MNHKKLIIIRHGARDAIDLTLDNELNEQGKLQAEALAAHFKKTFGHLHALFLSSPKIRCIQTLQPTCHAFSDKAVIEVNDLLDERQKTKEDDEQFGQRIQEFLSWWQYEQNLPEITFACTHGDWVPLALEILNATEHDVSKAGWIELGIVNGQLQVVSSTKKIAID